MPSLSIPLVKSTPFNPEIALKSLRGQADWVGLRYVNEKTHSRSVRNGRPEDNSVVFDHGAMVEVLIDGHFGYAGTSDLSSTGLQKALDRAKMLAKAGSQHKVTHFDLSTRPASVGHYRTPYFQGLDSTSLSELTDLLIMASEKLKASEKIVTALAHLRFIETTLHFVSSNGANTLQEFLFLTNNFQATAQEGSESQTRTLNGGVARCLQMGLEAFDRDQALKDCENVAKQALELLAAPNCPTDQLDLLLAPDQMLLQIHESIGHHLELDRILGDERNYAGWSFVQPQDFGTLKYGSSLMNVTFDPSVPGEFASYAFDDCGNPAQREFLIEKGLLKKGLGSLESQFRSQIPGVANFRSSSWNRAPIDRMANINLEPGNSKLADMISQTERGIYMESNVSWSIDDYRNKFQFGCEYARLIENGQLTKVVKNPNYRGVTVPFWNSLKAVGSADEVEIFGSPWCGKGEPSQAIRVGHSAPPCLFEKVEVFGGGK
ncbi:MAG: TldD/PmbA family protein [Pseudobdellovibrionaceae bacterium]